MKIDWDSIVVIVFIIFMFGGVFYGSCHNNNEKEKRCQLVTTVENCDKIFKG